MRSLTRFIAGAAAILGIVALVYGARWVWIGLHVGTGFAAKVACSAHFNSGQDPQRVLRDYIYGEVAPLGPLISLTAGERDLTARAVGVSARALYRPGFGCTLLTGEGEAELVSAPRPEPLPPLPMESAWPDGEAPASSPPPEIAAAVDAALREPEGSEPGHVRATTAVVIVHDGKLIAERYAEGYGPETPMLSWSMAKSVLAALIGVAAADGRLDLQARAPVPAWRGEGDPRAAITLDHLLRQSSGLEFDEHYGAVNDVSRMLYTMPDTGTFAAAKPLIAAPDTRWSYSSGTSNLIARILRDSFEGDLEALTRYARERLFVPAGMHSAFFEPDVSGTPIGSSYVFMTARDWARFGELHLRDGVWNGRRVLPEGWVRYISTPTPAAPQGSYGAHWWLNAGDPKDPSKRTWPELPTDIYAALGHSGQYVLVVPSAKLVIVRLGLTLPDEGNDGAAELTAAVIEWATGTL